MEQQLKVLYNKLAMQVIAMIPAKWDVFHYLGEVEKGKQSHSSVFYFNDIVSGTFIQSHSISKTYGIPDSTYMPQWLQLNKLLLEVYDCFAENGQPPWEQMSLSVKQSGEFKVNYLYDVMEGLGPLEREMIWAHNTFGYLPEEGSAARKILDKHLKS